jgi:deoxyribonucleoside regulator
MEPMRSHNKTQLLAKVASLYYEEDKSQAEIARQLGYSRSAISRILNRARENGIVEITIHYPVERSHYHERLLKQVFGLQDAYVLEADSQDYDQLVRNLGQFGVDVAMDYVVEGGSLGITWGRAMYEFVHAMRTSTSSNVKVVQLMGALGKEGRYFDGHSLALLLASKLGGSHYVPFVPLVVESEDIRQGLSNQPNIQEFEQVSKNLDLAVIGVGSMELEYSGVYQAGYLSQEELNTLREMGAVGELLGYFIDINGDRLDVEFHDRLFSTYVGDLNKSGCKVVAIAGGKIKTEGVLGALRGKYVDVLVTDSGIAEAVLKMESRLLV